MEFLKLSDVKINPAGYLVTTKTNKPVYHAEFVQAQMAAHFIVELSKALKGKNFKTSTVDNYDAIVNQVRASIVADRVEVYVDTPKEPKSKVVDEMTNHALAFIEYQNDKTNVENINYIMNEFNIVRDIETVGDYFEEKLIKLKALYSESQILEAVKIRVEALA